MGTPSYKPNTDQCDNGYCCLAESLISEFSNNINRKGGYKRNDAYDDNLRMKEVRLVLLCNTQEERYQRCDWLGHRNIRLDERPKQNPAATSHDVVGQIRDDRPNRSKDHKDAPQSCPQPSNNRVLRGFVHIENRFKNVLI